MPSEISIIIGNEILTAELNDSETSKKLIGKLPIESGYNTWGDEIYFSIPVKADPENPKEVVGLGELGYWPPGNAFCIFYGATPGSTENEIRPASPVNPLGYLKGDPKVLKKIAGKNRKIRLELIKK